MNNRIEPRFVRFDQNVIDANRVMSISYSDGTLTVLFDNLHEGRYPIGSNAFRVLCDGLTANMDRVRVLEQKLDQLYYAPGMPGAVQAQKSFEEVAKSVESANPLEQK